MLKRYEPGSAMEHGTMVQSKILESSEVVKIDTKPAARQGEAGRGVRCCTPNALPSLNCQSVNLCQPSIDGRTQTKV